jgi:hypothetical protein
MSQKFCVVNKKQKKKAADGNSEIEAKFCFTYMAQKV